MITTTVAELINVVPIFQKISNTNMAAKNAFRVLKLMKELEREYQSIKVVRESMIEKYVVKNETGTYKVDDNGNFLIEKELLPDYTKEVNSFLEEKIELNAPKLPETALENIELTPAQLLMLEPFIE